MCLEVFGGYVEAYANFHAGNEVQAEPGMDRAIDDRRDLRPDRRQDALDAVGLIDGSADPGRAGRPRLPITPAWTIHVGLAIELGLSRRGPARSGNDFPLDFIPTVAISWTRTTTAQRL